VSGSLALIQPLPDVGEVPRQQLMDAFHGMIGDAFQHLGQVVVRIEPVELGGFGQRVDWEASGSRGCHAAAA